MLSKNHWVKYSNLGFQVIVTLGLFGGLGYWLDNLFFDFQPLFLIILLLVGVVVSLYHLWLSIFK